MRGRHLLLMMLCVAGALGAEPKRDRYGDPLPEGAVARLGSLRLRNGELIFTAAFTADGKALAAMGNSSISFWDPVTGKLVRRVEFKKAPFVRMRRIGSDGNTWIELHANNRNILSVMDASRGAERSALNYSQCGFIHTLDVSRESKIIAAVHQRSISLWDASSGKLLHEFKDPPIVPLPSPKQLSVLPSSGPTVIALTPDGKQLVLPHADGSLHLVDVATGKELRAFEMPPARRGRTSSRHLQRLVVSPDGRYLAFGNRGCPLTVCDLTIGKRLSVPASPQDYPFRGVVFAPNGRVLALGDETGIRLIAVPSGKEIRRLPLTAGVFNQLHFSPDGRTLAAVGPFTIRLWDMTAQRWRHPPVGHDGAIHSILFFADGKRLLSADYTSGMTVWDIDSGQTLAQQTNTHSAPPVLGGDGESVRFTLFNSAHRWDPRTGRDEAGPRVNVGLSTQGGALSPDGRSLAVQCFDSGGTRQKPVFTYPLRLYDVKSGKFVELRGLPPGGGVSQMLFSPDSRHLATRSHDGSLRLWDRDTGKLVHEFKSAGPRTRAMPLPLSFAADGRSILTWSGSLMRICEIAGSADRLQIPTVPNSLNALAYSSDARFVACGQRDGRILVYSAISGKQLAHWQGDQGAVHSLAFNREDRLLASGGVNGTILVWKVPQDDSVPAVRTAEEAASLWQVLGSLDAAAANRSLAGLAAAPAHALPLFKERLPSIVNQREKPQLARWIAELDDDSFKVRDRATRELALIGADAADALRQALHKAPSTEAKRRIEDLLTRLKKGGDSQRLRFLRALEVLERIGTPQAKELLRDLAGKPLLDELKDEVQASLRRMGDKP